MFYLFCVFLLFHSYPVDKFFFHISLCPFIFRIEILREIKFDHFVSDHELGSRQEMGSYDRMSNFSDESSGEGNILSTHGELVLVSLYRHASMLISFVDFSIRERGQCEWSSRGSHNFVLMHTIGCVRRAQHDMFRAQYMTLWVHPLLVSIPRRNRDQQPILIFQRGGAPGRPVKGLHHFPYWN